MPIPLVVYAGVAAASAIYGGISASNTSKANAAAAQAAALQNSINVQQTGMMNSALAGMAGQINAQNQYQSAYLNAQSSLLVNAYNEALTRSVVDYNVSLLEAELPALLRQWELSDTQLQQQRARSTGSILATQSSSGTVMNVQSNLDTVVSNEAAFAMDAAVLRHNYDQQSADVLNAIARSKWEGQVQIQKMNYEAEMGVFNAMGQAHLNSRGIMVNTTLSMMGGTYNANQQASTIMSQGNAAYQQGMNTASQQLTAGVISGIGNAAAMYAAGSGGGEGLGKGFRSSSISKPVAVNYTPPNLSQLGTSLIA